MLRELKNSPATYKGQQRLRRKRTAMIAFVLILVLLVRPTGLFGEKLKEKV